jgi:hypothetical protein
MQARQRSKTVSEGGSPNAPARSVATPPADGGGYRTVAVVEQEATHRLATVRFTVPAESSRGVVADLLFASSGIEPEVVAAAETARVAQVGHLIALKLLSRDDRTRPQDLADLHALFAVATDGEVTRARTAVRLIAERGYAREKNLRVELQQWLSERRAR